MPVPVSIRGARAELLAFDGVHVVLKCPFPAPPGSSLSCVAGGDAGTLRVKVSACKRTDEGAAATFRVEGRLVDLTRGKRLFLEAALQRGSSSSDTVPPSQRPPTR